MTWTSTQTVPHLHPPFHRAGSDLADGLSANLGLLWEPLEEKASCPGVVPARMEGLQWPSNPPEGKTPP